MNLPRNSSSRSRSLFRPLAGLAVACALLTGLAVAATPALADWQSGIEAFQSGDYAAAESAFRQVTETQPEWYGGHFMLGRVLVEQDRDAAALSSLRKAHELEARPEVALLLARTALSEDEASVARDALAGEPPATVPAEQKVAWLSLRARAAADDASRLRDLESATTLAPRDLGVRLSAADAAVAAGRLDQAERHLAAAAELSPGDEAVLVRRVKVGLARSDAAEGPEQAALCLQTAEAAAELADATGKASHLSIAGRSYLCADDLDRAGDFFGRALDAESSWNHAYDLAKVQLKQQQWEPAEQTLRPFLEVRGEGRAKVHQLVGRSLEGQQRFLEAIPHYEIAGDADGIAHAREGQAALDHNKQQQFLVDQMENLEGQIESLEDGEAGLY